MTIFHKMVMYLTAKGKSTMDTSAKSTGEQPLAIRLLLACFVFCRRFATVGERGWAVYSLLAGLGMLVTFVLAAVGFDQNPSLVHFAGVFQRLSIIIGLTWIALLAFRLVSKKPPVGR